MHQTLEQIARSVLLDLGEDTSRLEQFLHWAIKGYREYFLDSAKKIKTCQPKLSERNTAAIPDDFIDWVRIGVIERGRVIKFTHDPRIAEDAYKKVENKNEHITLGYPYYHDYNAKGEYTGQKFGLGEKHNGYGYFTITDCEIQFNALRVSPKRVYMEYLSNELGPATLVHPYAVNAIETYVHWKKLLHSNGSGINERREAERLHNQAIHDAGVRKMDLTVDEIFEIAENASGFRI